LFSAKNGQKNARIKNEECLKNVRDLRLSTDEYSGTSKKMEL